MGTPRSLGERSCGCELLGPRRNDTWRIEDGMPKMAANGERAMEVETVSAFDHSQLSSS